MTRPLLLDLFCGAGGAAMGYHRAGFDVVGVDIMPQPRYPFAFVQGDALRPPVKLSRFAAIHASPPCQAHTALRTMPSAHEHQDLIPATRDLLVSSGLPYIIENVVGAPLRDPVVLCGTMFGLGVRAENAELWRHRLFEVNWGLVLTPQCRHRAKQWVVGVYGGGGRDFRRVVQVQGNAGGRSTRDGTQGFSVNARREAMGIDWMLNRELTQAIPPAYTEFIGRQLLRALEPSGSVTQ